MGVGSWRALRITTSTPLIIALQIVASPAIKPLCKGARPVILELYVRTRSRPDWLHVDRVLGCWRLANVRSGRMQYQRSIQAYVDEMAGCKKPGEFDPNWSKIRRGWFWGSKQPLS